MSTSNIGLSYLRPALPIFTATLGALGVLGGAMMFNNPIEGAHTFGIILPPSALDSKVPRVPSPTVNAYIRIHGIRNIASGLTLIALTSFSKFAPLCKASPIAAEAVKKSIGISLLIGSVVGFVDGWILGEFVKGDGLSGEAVELGSKQSTGHSTFAVVIAALGSAYLFT